VQELLAKNSSWPTAPPTKVPGALTADGIVATSDDGLAVCLPRPGYHPCPPQRSPWRCFRQDPYLRRR
jgi:hypothetical protein